MIQIHKMVSVTQLSEKAGIEVIEVSTLREYIDTELSRIDNTSSDLYDHEGIAFGAGQKAVLEKIKKELEGR